MAAWLLFAENTEFAKAALRAELPGVKSSHVAEAFAASLGFQTYAALLATQKEANPARPPLRHADNALLSKRLAELGYTISVSDIIADIARRERIPNPCWQEFPNQDFEANNSWFYQCQRFGLPNVCLRVRKKYASLCWDCISISPREERHVRDRRGELVRAMYKKFQTIVGPGAAGKPLFFGSAFAGSVDNLMPAVARKLADSLFEMLYLPMLDPAASRVADWP